MFFSKKHSYLCINEIYYIFSKKLKNIYTFFYKIIVIPVNEIYLLFRKYGKSYFQKKLVICDKNKFLYFCFEKYIFFKKKIIVISVK